MYVAKTDTYIIIAIILCKILFFLNPGTVLIIPLKLNSSNSSGLKYLDCSVYYISIFFQFLQLTYIFFRELSQYISCSFSQVFQLSCALLCKTGTGVHNFLLRGLPNGFRIRLDHIANKHAQGINVASLVCLGKTKLLSDA